MKKPLIFFLFWLQAVICTAQAEFQRYYTFSTWSGGQKILEYPSMGYVVLGFDVNLLFDSLGQPTTSDVQALGCVIDYNGDTIKSVIVGSPDTAFAHANGNEPEDRFRAGFFNSDSLIVAIGETHTSGSTSVYDYSLRYMKFDRNLNIVSSNYFHLADSSLYINFNTGKQFGRDRYILPGYQTLIGSNQDIMCFTLFDSSGSVEIHKQILPFLSGNLISVNRLNDQFYFAGKIYNSISDWSPLVVKTDSLGNVIWHKILPYSGDLHLASDVVNTADGNIVFSWANVAYHTGASNKVWLDNLTKIDSGGNEIWTKNFGYTFDYHRRISVLSNGNLLVIGFQSDTISFERRALIRLCDSDGNLLWERTYIDSPARLVRCFDGTVTGDGGFILTGDTYCCNFTPSLGWTSSVWVLKTDSLGLLTEISPPPTESSKNEVSLSVYPNPVVEKCNISVLIPPVDFNWQEKSMALHLFDIVGREIKIYPLEMGLNNLSLDVNFLQPGVYQFSVTVNGFVKSSTRFIKN